MKQFPVLIRQFLAIISETTFAFSASIHFLITKPQLKAMLSSAIDKNDVTTRTRRVLYVDDMRELREVAHLALTSVGHIVDCVADGADGFERIAANPGSYDIVITDHHMAGLNGIGLVIKLREIGYPRQDRDRELRAEPRGGRRVPPARGQQDPLQACRAGRPAGAGSRGLIGVLPAFGLEPGACRASVRAFTQDRGGTEERGVQGSGSGC